MREIVEATRTQAIGAQIIGGFGSFTAPVFEESHRSS
jgi:hypothetical protein